MRKLSIRNILVPTDFSAISIDAIATAKCLAERFNAKAQVVHVNQFSSPPASLSEQSKIVAKKTGLSPKVQRPLVMGAAPFREICNLAREIPADLILMPTHGYTGVKHVFLGSTAERVVQHSPSPVFVVRKHKRRVRRLSIKKILVPLDFSDCSRQGLHYAIRFAKEFEALMILLHATQLGYIYSSKGLGLYNLPGLQEVARERTRQRMRELVRTVNFGGVNFQTTLTTGSPVMDICSFAKIHDIDLIITSTHGFTGLKHALIGSVAERVVRHAPCSVLVVPSHPRTRLAGVRTARSRRVGKSSRPQ